MKSITIFAIIALSLFLVACGQQAAPAPSAPAAPAAPEAAPAQEPAPAAPVVPQANTASGENTAVTNTFGAVNKSTALDVDSVSCDRASKTISFRFKNTDTKDWAMNQQAGWADKSLVNIHVIVNSYAANGNTQPTPSGVKQFGPNWPFSKNCGDTDVLKPGDEVTCTLAPVPLKDKTTLEAGNNEIFIDSPVGHHIIQFTCE